MASGLHLQQRHRLVVEGLAQDHLPGVDVWAYGSRVNGQSHAGSDLDLVLRGPTLAEIPSLQLGAFCEALQESTLPFLVEARDWARLPDRFHAEIQRNYVALASKTDGWRSVTLGDCATLVRDSVMPSACTDLPYIGLEHIGRGTLSLNDVGSAREVESMKTAFRAGDILFGKLRPYFRKVVRPRFDGICSTDIWVIRPEENVDAGFLFYMLASRKFVDFASQGAEGTRMPRAKWEPASRLAVRLPAVSEQRAIADLLGALDQKIDLNHRMARTLDEAVAGLFKSWFVDFDPVRGNSVGLNKDLPTAISSLFPSELAMSHGRSVPTGWSVRTLDEIAHFRNGLALQKCRPREGEESLPVLKINQLRSELLDDKELASSSIRPDCIVDNGQIVFSWSGSLLAKVWCGGRAALNQHLFKVTSTDYGDWFVLRWLHEHVPAFRSIASDKATTMGHIRRHHLNDALCIVPSDQVMRLADRIFEPMHERYIAARVESGELTQLRDGLLLPLISGEIRIPDAEEIVEAAT